MDFDDLDEQFAETPLRGESRRRAEVTPAQFAALPWPFVPCGFYTLTLTDGARKRFRIRLERGTFLPGKRTVSVHRKLPDGMEQPEREWETVAAIEAHGAAVFKRWRNDWEGRWVEALWLLVTGRPAPGYAFEVEPRCWLCMRDLKSDAQRASGLTPGCEKKVRTCSVTKPS